MFNPVKITDQRCCRASGMIHLMCTRCDVIEVLDHGESVLKYDVEILELLKVFSLLESLPI